MRRPRRWSGRRRAKRCPSQRRWSSGRWWALAGGAELVSATVVVGAVVGGAVARMAFKVDDDGGGGGRSPMWRPVAVRETRRREGGLAPSVVPACGDRGGWSGRRQRTAGAVGRGASRGERWLRRCGGRGARDLRTWGGGGRGTELREPVLSALVMGWRAEARRERSGDGSTEEARCRPPRGSGERPSCHRMWRGGSSMELSTESEERERSGQFAMSIVIGGGSSPEAPGRVRENPGW